MDFQFSIIIQIQVLFTSDIIVQVSARAESILIEGMSCDGELVPLLITAPGTSIGTHTALALDVEKNPANSHADLGVTCHVEPFEMVYVEVRKVFLQPTLRH